MICEKRNAVYEGTDRKGYKIMRKKLLAAAVLTLGILAAAGCNKKKPSTSEPTSINIEDYDIVSMNMDDYMILGEYKNIGIKYNMIEVTDESIKEQMDLMVKTKGDKIGLKEGNAKEGDLVNIDFEGKIDGVAFEGGSAKDQTVRIGDGQFIPGFEEALIDMQPGEVKDAPIKFPDDYNNKDYAGKDAVFTLTLNYIFPDELTDDIVAQMEEEKYSTVEEMEAFAKDFLERQAQENNESNITGLAFETILSNCAFKEVPEIIKENQRAELEFRYADAIDGGAYDLDTVIKYLYDCSADELIERYCKQRMAIQAIAKAEGITATDEEVDKRLEEVSAAYGLTPDQYMTMNMTNKKKLKELIISEKVQKFVRDNVKIIPYE